MDYPGKVITKTQVTPTQTSASGNWTLDDQAAAIKNNNWPVALVPNPISKSLRFNSADSTYLNRTPAGSGTLGVWTFSFWVKRAALSTTQTVYYSGTTNQRGGITFTSGDLINCQPFNSTGANASWTSTAVYRDPSAWYHVVIRAFSSATGNSFGGVELALYINGVQQTFTLSTAGTPTGGDRINDSQAKQIGQITPNGGGNYLDAYLTEFNFIDGQALTPSSFGMTNPQTGQWIPLKYSGTYGTNGFYLNFKDATSTTTLGYDYSGNANNWTTNNFSVTAGSGNDSLTDVPTPWFAYNTTGDVGGVIRGNYCTANPLKKPSTSTITNGNLDVAHTSAGGEQPATFAFSSGKWYWEASPSSVFAAYGVILTSVTPSASSINSGYHYYGGNGQFYTGTSGVAYGATFTSGDVIGVALNLDTNQITFYKNGVSQGAQSISAGEYNPDIAAASTNTTNCNFGQRPFAYTPPTGFRSLCTTNLPATAIGFGLTNQGDDYFNAVLWTGDGASSRNITGVGFQPDWVWLKSRSNATVHRIFDSVRGATKTISSDLTDAESTEAQQLTAFISDGFSLGSDVGTNGSARTFVAWNWKANGAGVTNTDGTITSTVSANTTAGFSISTYTGNGSSSQTVGHGLGVAPGMVIIKTRSNSDNWRVWHTSLTSGQTLTLNSTAAQAAAGFWPSSPSTSVVYLGTDTSVNSNTYTYVAYCFAAVPGYSAFGSYTGNGSTDGPFIYLGFRPKFVMFKSTGVQDWVILDSARDTYNVAGNYLRPNSSGAENGGSTPTTSTYEDFLSNGIKLRNNASSSGYNNTNGVTYIYACFAESPFQFANAR